MHRGLERKLFLAVVGVICLSWRICDLSVGDVKAVEALNEETVILGGFPIGIDLAETSGIGTVTFVRPQTGEFAALGHGISNRQTGALVNDGEGCVYKAFVDSVEMARVNKPGELRGYFSSEITGNIKGNTENGVFGNLLSLPFEACRVEIGKKEEIKTGKASVYCCVNGSRPREFEIVIEKIRVEAKDNKSMVIRITDKNLLKCTGGIIQGMSGSPLIQNGKLIGAVTHVFVNDPTRGYGIFIENMLAEAEEIK